MKISKILDKFNLPDADLLTGWPSKKIDKLEMNESFTFKWKDRKITIVRKDYELSNKISKYILDNLLLFDSECREQGCVTNSILIEWNKEALTCSIVHP